MSHSPLEVIRANDGIWLQDGPTNRMLIHAVLFIEPIELDTIRALLQTRLVDRDNGERFQRLRQFVVNERGRNYWQTMDTFDIANQIQDATSRELQTKSGLQEFIGEQAAHPLPEGLPPWRVDVIQGFERTRTALYFRFHHCMADGIALVQMLFAAIDPGTGERPAVQRWKPASRLGRMLRLPFLAPAILGRLVVSRADRSPLHGSPLAGEKRIAWSDPQELGRVKRIKDALGATVNDVLMAALAGAFNRYLHEHPDAPIGEVRASVPINIRSAHAPPRMENRFVAVLLQLPSGIRNPVDRVREVQKRMNRMKSSVEPIVMFGTIRFLLGALPAKLSRPLVDFFANKCTCVLTNVPGPPKSVYLGGKKITDFMFWVPQRATIGIGISILSYGEAIRIGVIADVKRIPNPERFIQAFEEELDELEREACAPIDA